MSYSYQFLQVSAGEDGIFTVQVNRPRDLNALNDAAIGEIDSCFSELGRDSQVRLVILTGAGDRAFVAGADISELAGQDSEAAHRRSRAGQLAFQRVEDLGKPVLAAIQGYALGGGFELALACHVRYASTKARLGLPEVTLGIIPGYGGTQRLQRIVGRGRALEWILSGAHISAEEALRIGVVNGLFPPECLLAEVEKIARKILSNGPIALRYALQAVLGGGDRTLSEGLALEAELFAKISDTEDMKEGMSAFLDKRKPHFRGG